MDNIFSVIFCSVDFEALHNWHDIGEQEPCWFLAQKHRHVFKIKVYKRVYHDNRDSEFIAFKHEVLKFLKSQFVIDAKSGIPDISNRSCEMLGRMILNQFDAIKVEVSEDGENGAIVYDANSTGV